MVGRRGYLAMSAESATKWLVSHWVVICTIAAVSWGAVTWAFSVEAFKTETNGRFGTQQEALNRIDRNVERLLGLQLEDQKNGR